MLEFKASIPKTGISTKKPYRNMVRRNLENPTFSTPSLFRKSSGKLTNA
jgi:hypothetical protein